MCECASQRESVFSRDQIRRLAWRNLSPVVDRVTTTGITIARHADGRLTLEV
jgi:hypothetical protein